MDTQRKIKGRQDTGSGQGREQHSDVDLARRVPMDRLVSETARARH